MGGPGSGRKANPSVPDVMSKDDLAELAKARVPLPSLLDLGDESIPLDLRAIPERPLGMLILRACGLSQREIARVCGISQPVVHEALQRYDPERVFVLSEDTVERIALRRWSHVEHLALSHATPRLDEIGPAQAITLAAIARDKQNQTKARERASTDMGTIQLRLTAAPARLPEDASLPHNDA